MPPWRWRKNSVSRAWLPPAVPAIGDILAYPDERADQPVRAVRAELHVASRAAAVASGADAPDLIFL